MSFRSPRIILAFVSASVGALALDGCSSATDSTGGSAAAAGVSGTVGAVGGGPGLGSGGLNAGGGASGSGPGAAGSTASGGSVAAAGSGAAGVGGATAGASGSSGGAGGATSGAGGVGGGAAGSSPSTGALIHNDTFWKDTSGTPVYSQGGGVFLFGDTYYWYGVKYNGAVSYAANPTKSNSDTSFNAVTCYSSKDLVNWKFESDVLTAAGSGTEVAGASWFGRLGVAYNATTKQYVLVSQYSGTAGTGELFAKSSTPNGKFTFDHIQASVPNVVNTTTGDQTIFVDDDGSAYVICSSSSGRSNLYVAPLHASDFLSVDPATRIFGGVGREGNAMFKYSGHYYFCSSDLHGWNASHSYCISATNIMGPYGAEFVMANTDADFSHVTQTGFFITVHGSKQSTVIFAGDRWADFAGNGLGYNQWLPLTFTGTTPQFQSLTEWSLNAGTGEWSVGPDNNYALNPSFEADRVTMTQPAGWTTTGTSTNSTGGHSGRWLWQLSAQSSIEQAVANLPNGTYTLSAWVKSTGGQSVAQIYAKNFGGTEKDSALNTALGSWTQKTITGIAVSNGQCQVGVTTTGSAAQTVSIDDLSLTRVGP